MIYSPETFRFIFSFALFLFGLAFVSAGFWKLMGFGLVPHAKALAAQSVRIGQKALTDDITRITQAASQLTESVNNLLRTSAGVGAFMIVIGFVLLACSYGAMFANAPTIY